MNLADLSRLRLILSNATPRPWYAHETSDSKIGNVKTRADIHWMPDPGDGLCQDVEPLMAANAELIVEAINVLPDLLDTIERLRRKLDNDSEPFRSEEMPGERNIERGKYARELLTILNRQWGEGTGPPAYTPEGYIRMTPEDIAKLMALERPEREDEPLEDWMARMAAYRRAKRPLLDIAYDHAWDLVDTLRIGGDDSDHRRRIVNRLVAVIAEEIL